MLPPNLKVKINDKVITPLFLAHDSIEDLKYIDLKKRPPIAYHYLYYDVQTNTTYSSDLKESNRIEIRDQYSHSKGFFYRYESEWEMVYLRSSYSSSLCWSWEFDKSFGISSLVFDFFYYSFHIDTVNWYISKEKPNGSYDKMYLKEKCLLLPFNFVSKALIVDKKVDITEYMQDSSSFYLICDIPNGDSAVHFFRSKSLSYRDIHPYNLNPNNYQHKNKYPFNVHIQLSPKSKLKNNNDQLNNSNNNNQTNNKKSRSNSGRSSSSISGSSNNNNNNNSNNQINNSYQYYFIEKYPGLKSPIEVESWSKERVQTWLSDLLLFEFVEYFKKNNIDGRILLSMDLDNAFTSLSIPDYRIAKLKKNVNRVRSFGAKKETIFTVDKKMIVSNTLLYLKKKLVNNDDSSSTRNYSSSITKSSSQLGSSGSNNGSSSSIGDSTKYSINDSSSDYKIIVQDKPINVHRIKLSKIEYFKVLFNSEFKENKDNYTTFNDENYETFKSLLEILYLPNEEKVDYLKTLEPIQLKDILLLSNRLLYHKLQFMIENYILWNVNQDNVLDVYKGFPENGAIQSFTKYYINNIKNHINV